MAHSPERSLLKAWKSHQASQTQWLRTRVFLSLALAACINCSNLSVDQRNSAQSVCISIEFGHLPVRDSSANGMPTRYISIVGEDAAAQALSLLWPKFSVIFPAGHHREPSESRILRRMVLCVAWMGGACMGYDGVGLALERVFFGQPSPATCFDLSRSKFHLA